MFTKAHRFRYSSACQTNMPSLSKASEDIWWRSWTWDVCSYLLRLKSVRVETSSLRDEKWFVQVWYLQKMEPLWKMQYRFSFEMWKSTTDLILLNHVPISWYFIHDFVVVFGCLPLLSTILFFIFVYHTWHASIILDIFITFSDCMCLCIIWIQIEFLHTVFDLLQINFPFVTIN